MVCPKCKSKSFVIDTKFNPENNEMYRYRKCSNKNCNFGFYSIEFGVENDKNFAKTWREAIKGGR